MAHAEVHIGDVGTRYLVPVRDDGVPFDPSEAHIRQLLFRLPGGEVITKNAEIVTDAGSPVTEWYLAYTVLPHDGIGSPPGDFHGRVGPLKIQAFLAWTDGSQFHSSIATTDRQGRNLRIYRNLW